MPVLRRFFLRSLWHTVRHFLEYMLDHLLVAESLGLVGVHQILQRPRYILKMSLS